MSYLAEQNVIGALLIDNDAMGKIYNILEPEMFANELLGRMYYFFMAGYEQQSKVDPVVLQNRIASGCGIPLREVQEEIRDCVLKTTTSLMIKEHAEEVVRGYKASRLNRLLRGTLPSETTVEDQIRQLINELEALQDNRWVSSKTLSEITEEYKAQYFRDNVEEKMYLGFPRLDNILGGLEGGDMIVIGARPAVGKSALVTQITTNLAKRGKRVGFFNLEMQEKQIYERFIVSHSGISLTRLRRAVKFLGDEEERFRAANEVLAGRDNIVITTGSKAVSEIRTESRHMKYDVIIIDYLQLLRSDKTYRGNRYAEVGAISKAIKALAMELNIPIIALSQLNRVSEMKETREPTMAELREAGDIEQDASVIMLMWNLSQEDRSRKGLKVEKQRQGGTGKIVLDFKGDLMQFVESEETVEHAREWAAQKDDDCPFQ